MADAMAGFLEIFNGVNMPTIEQRVKQIIAEQCGISPDVVTGEKSFFADLGLDSLDMVEIVMAAEDEFRIYIDDASAEACKTVQQAIDLVCRSPVLPTDEEARRLDASMLLDKKANGYDNRADDKALTSQIERATQTGVTE